MIRHDEQGYYLADEIVVRRLASQAVSEVLPTTKAPDSSDRQQWVLEQLKAGIKIQRKALEDHFDVSDKSAKRDLSQLVKRGLIEFVRAGRHGYYRLGMRRNHRAQAIAPLEAPRRLRRAATPLHAFALRKLVVGLRSRRWAARLGCEVGGRLLRKR